MAYLTCPWCMTPQLTSDDADHYQCYTCYAEIRFFTCPSCGVKQTVNQKWAAFTCSGCESKIDLPRRWSYATSTKAREVQAAAYPWPRF
ncbi:MAG TPA: hypothetical protein VHM47_09845 [Actinomycetota bacterium]|nr:hypothetical protein [Actinomycetota bacterium]